MEAVRFRLLGPLEAQYAGEEFGWGGPKERAVLALLLLNANHVVTLDSMIDGLWGESPPRSARHTVEAYVSRLRKRLEAVGAESTIERRPGGYLLRCPPDAVDLCRFEALVEQGRAALDAGEAEEALDAFEDALDLWRGEPMSDLAGEPFGAREIPRLDELRLAAVEARMDAALMLGREAELVGELAPLVACHPYRERFRVQLMTALYRTGRQTEALDCYRAGRRLLVDELGIEPSEELQALQRAILTHDRTIAAPSEPHAPSFGPTEPAQGARLSFRWRRRFLGAVLAIALVLAIGETAGFMNIGGSTSSWVGPGIAFVDPVTARVVHLRATSSPPGEIVPAGGWLWVTQPRAGTILRLDPRPDTPVKTIKVGDQAGGLAAEAGAVWVASSGAGAIERIDTATGRIDRVVRVGNDPTALASGYGSIWVVNRHDRNLSRIDPRAGRVVAVIETDSAGPGVAVGAGGVWVSDEPSGRITQIDPTTNTVRRAITVGNGPTAIAVADGSVWVADRIDGTLTRIDLRSGLVNATIQAGESPSDVTAVGGKIWVANELSNTVSEFGPGLTTPRVLKVGERPTNLTPRGRQVIVSLAGS